MFASLSRPDFESLTWTDGFTEQHFKAFIARQGTSRDKIVASGSHFGMCALSKLALNVVSHMRA